MTLDWRYAFPMTLGLLAISLAIVMASMFLPWKLALLLAPAAAVAGLIFLQPFLGLVMLIALAQLDAIANIISNALPFSAYKLLTLITVVGVTIDMPRRSKRHRFGPDTPGMRFAIFFGLAAVVSLLLSEHWSAGVDRMTRLASVMVLFYLVVLLIDTKERLEIVVWAIIASGTVSAVIMLFDHFFGGHLLSTEAAAMSGEWSGISRSSGASDYNPTTASHMLLASNVLAIIMFVEGGRFRLLAAATVLLCTVALVFSYARSAGIALAVIMICIAVFYRQRRFFPISVITVVLLAGAAIPFVPPAYWERMATLADFNTDRTLWRRLSYNLIGVQLLATHPVFGIGPGNFPHYYIDEAYRWYPGREPVPRQLHNTYLEVAAETGLVGFTCFMGVLLMSLRAMIVTIGARSDSIRRCATALAFAFPAFLVASLFMPNEDTKYMWVLSGLGCAAFNVARLSRDGSAPRVASGRRA
ncbi:O-antigen ligase family protein [Mesorhizobium mediterraneum]|uniref:O-antigen ligase family protein n=1 Tax=Mesorhizobium mediterraneum TaxID=43617 RepID=UPI0017809B6D|nr:O-antigen ligase family protein [Mesorhizobium mediterraneum]